ncbi:hypothetical protein BDN72DRAFT_324445 [Pluteus cervinus]|uniref:Uncharacterized protein n=1 Tax=Pluteus cervinus TaxID=181527 RepID=A0ACD3B439_9AGAR|nr:hypothetical protein BDN72DRAFT_324445 [Pluteus cervinus]
MSTVIGALVDIPFNPGSDRDMSPPADDTHEDNMANAAVDLSMFEGFTEFKLDLSCLSAPPSPCSSATELPPSTSPTGSRSSCHSVAFSSRPSSPMGAEKVSYRIPSPQLSAVTATTAVRGSWPLVKYVGRGTPVDRNRRIEWGAPGSDEVGEDGVLFAAARSTSLESGLRASDRSISQEWHYTAPSLTSHRSSPFLTRASSTRFAMEGPVPESAQIRIEGLGSDHSAEWESIIQTVLDSGTSSSSSSAGPNEGLKTPEATPTPKANELRDTDINGDADSISDKTPDDGLDGAGLEMDLGLDHALDLGLGLHGGMNWFNLGLIPDSGRDTPSVYSSQPPSPQTSPPPSVHALDRRSIGSVKTEPHGRTESKLSTSTAWWRRIFRRLRHVRKLIRTQSNRL